MLSILIFSLLVTLSAPLDRFTSLSLASATGPSASTILMSSRGKKGSSRRGPSGSTLAMLRKRVDSVKEVEAKRKLGCSPEIQDEIGSALGLDLSDGKCGATLITRRTTLTPPTPHHRNPERLRGGTKTQGHPPKLT